MKQSRASLAALVLLLSIVPPVAAIETLGMVTASPRGTYIEIGRELARTVAPAADIALEVHSSDGSADNVRRLRLEPGIHLGIVQSDVYEAYIERANEGDPEAAALIRPLRVVLPLYNEEIYFVVRAESNLNYLHEIRDARISVGPAGGGTALTASTLYRLLFGTPIPPQNVFHHSSEEGLVRLTTDRSVDVVAIVAEQPAKLLADMKPEARQFIHLLAVDPRHPSSAELFSTYFPTTVLGTSYPNLLSRDLPAIAVKAYLVTSEIDVPQDALVRFARSLCRSLPILRETGHPKWREVQLGLPPLGRGWSYYEPTSRELRACLSGPLADSPRATPERSRSPVGESR